MAMASVASKSSAARAARVEEIANSLRQEAGLFSWGPKEARLLVQALRLLAEGRLISSEQLRQLAAGLELPAEAADAAFDRISERNEAGEITGISGLSLSLGDWPHRFTVAGRNLSTWCALDTLFLPQLLKQTATVESPDPLSGEVVSLTIGPERVKQYTPGTAVVSLRVPRALQELTDVSRRETVEHIWSTFCCYSHYFTSPESAREWLSTRGPDLITLSVEEAYEVMRIWVGDTLKYA